MKNLTEMTIWFQTVFMQAREEAFREYRSEFGVEHLLMALSLQSGSIGQTLRSMGLNYADIRQALHQVREADLRSIGVAIAQPERPIEAAACNNIAPVAGVKQLIEAAYEEKTETRPFELVLCEKLFSERTGTIAAILAQLGVDSADVLAKLREGILHDKAGLVCENESEKQRSLPYRDSTFIASAPSQVLATLRDPGQVEKWLMFASDVKVTGGYVTGRFGVRHKFEAAMTADTGVLVEWYITVFPTERIPAQIARWHVAPEDTGSRVTLECYVIPPEHQGPLSRALARILRPLADWTQRIGNRNLLLALARNFR